MRLRERKKYDIRNEFKFISVKNFKNIFLFSKSCHPLHQRDFVYIFARKIY
jgi:hypothetical protein